MEACGECSVFKVWERHHAALEAFAERSAGDSGLRYAEPCDIVQDVVVTACEHCDTVSILPLLQCRAWMFVCLRLHLKRARRESTKLETVLGATLDALASRVERLVTREAPAENALAAEETRTGVEDILRQRLSPEERDLIRQRFWEERSVEEMARSEELSVSGMYKTLDRLCERMRVPLAGI